MGAWGTDLFEDDFALDVKGDFEDRLEEGFSVADATTEVLEEYAYVFDADIDDDHEQAMLYLVLAVLQQERGQLQPEIKEIALKFIDEGRGLSIWEDDPADLAERKAVYQRVREQLNQA